VAVRKGGAPLPAKSKKIPTGLKAGWRHGLETRRLFDRARHRLVNRCPTRCQKFSALHATIQLYEAGEGVPAGLKAMTTAGRGALKNNPVLRF
jgi:hypothetical protein